MLEDMLEGKEVCAHCTGYGSSLQDPVGIDVCTVCGGSGLINQTPSGERKEYIL